MKGWMAVVVPGLGLLMGCMVDQHPAAATSALGTSEPVCFTGTCVPETTPIYAGQHIEIGTASVTTSGDDFVVSLATTGGWELGLVHVYIGYDPVPTNGGGNVAPGRFPYHFPLEPPVTSAELRIPMADVGAECGETLTVAIHMEAMLPGGPSETAWAFGTPFTGRQWGWSFTYDVCCGGSDACVMPPEFWATHVEEWPRWITTLGFGGTLHDQEALLAILAMDPSTDASIALAQEWIAVKLNWYCGVVVDDDTWAVLLRAGSWFYRNRDADGYLPYGVDPASPAGLEALGHAEILAGFNDGEAGVPACFAP